MYGNDRIYSSTELENDTHVEAIGEVLVRPYGSAPYSNNKSAAAPDHPAGSDRTAVSVDCALGLHCWAMYPTTPCTGNVGVHKHLLVLPG